MKHKYFYLFIAGILFIFIAAGYALTQTDSPAKTVQKELNLLKKLDPSTIMQYASLDDFLEGYFENPESEDELIAMLTLFFEKFDYKILETTADGNKAVVRTRIQTIDAESVVKDFYQAVVIHHIDLEASKKFVSIPLDAYLQIFREVLEKNDYETVSSEFNILLNREDEDSKWRIQVSNELKSSLIGDFVSYTKEVGLFTASEIVEVTLDHISQMEAEKLLNYFAISDAFSFGMERGKLLDEILAEQIISHFNYRIISASGNEDTAEITVQITSLYMEEILIAYAESLHSYGITSEAITASQDEQVETMYQFLLDALRSNAQSTTTTITLTLVQNGIGWSLNRDSAFTNAILGNFEEASETLNLILQVGNNEDFE